MKRRSLAGVGLVGLVVVLAAAPRPALASAAGTLYAFGDNHYGQLGIATNINNDNPNPPGPVTLPEATGPVVQVAAGSDFSLVVTSTGQLYAFGDNHDGQLGSATNNGSDTANPTPTLVSLPGATGPVVQVAAGVDHGLAVTSTGQLYAFGDNYYGELGNATNNGSDTANPTPTLVSLPGATGGVVQVAAGDNDSLAVTSTGQLYTFGYNQFGELGISNNSGTTNADPTPALVSLPGASGGVVQVAAGGLHSLVVTSTGQLYAFGDNYSGQLGNTENNNSGTPNPTPALVSLPGAAGGVVQVAAGYDHSLAVTSTGQLYAFGSNTSGQLGSTTHSGSAAPSPTPAPVSLPDATGGVLRVGAGNEQSLAVTSTGQLYAFGDNSFGELGNSTNNGTANPNPTPTLVSLQGGSSIEAVARGPEAVATLVVLDGLSVATASLPGGKVGQPYAVQLQASGGTAPETWSASGLPPGLALDPSTGVISGTPTQAGSSNPAVSVTDGDGIVASRTLELSIELVPRLSGLRVRPRRLSLAGRLVNGRCVKPTRSDRHHRSCRRRLRLRVSFTLNTRETVTITFARISRGRRVRGGCVRPTHANRRHRACTRLTALPGRSARTAAAGAHTFTIVRAPLTPGTYQLTATSNGSNPQKTTITIAR
jgi:alpha-tubulin suppressor-like RCC1 family protein